MFRSWQFTQKLWERDPAVTGTGHQPPLAQAQSFSPYTPRNTPLIPTLATHFSGQRLKCIWLGDGIKKMMPKEYAVLKQKTGRGTVCTQRHVFLGGSIDRKHNTAINEDYF